jgi:phosphatidylserine/phosphatidylglycerophosphate/cardiolipin synthase-like enzyme
LGLITQLIYIKLFSFYSQNCLYNFQHNEIQYKMDKYLILGANEYRNEVYQLLEEARRAKQNNPKLPVKIFMATWLIESKLALNIDGTQPKATVAETLGALRKLGCEVSVSISNHAFRLPSSLCYLRLRNFGIDAKFSHSARGSSNHQKVTGLSIGDDHYLLVSSANLTHKLLFPKRAEGEVSVLFHLNDLPNFQPNKIEDYYEAFTRDDVEILSQSGESNSIIRARLVELIADARESIYIEDQFAAFGRCGLLKSVNSAIDRGLDVSLTIPGKGTGLVTHAMFNFFARLRFLGVRSLAESDGTPAFTHAKVFGFDVGQKNGKITIGSWNATGQSLTDGEVTAVISDTKFAARVVSSLSGVEPLESIRPRFSKARLSR